MRVITNIADRLLGRLAPKTKAEAACQAEGESWCEGGVMYFRSVCPPYGVWVIGSC